MRSVENATTALRDGDADRAIKMMLSTDELCHKVIAPPTIHGLAMRVLSDAYLAKDNMEDAKKALEKAFKPAKGAVARPGIKLGEIDFNGAGEEDLPEVSGLVKQCFLHQKVEPARITAQALLEAFRATELAKLCPPLTETEL